MNLDLKRIREQAEADIRYGTCELKLTPGEVLALVRIAEEANEVQLALANRTIECYDCKGSGERKQWPWPSAVRCVTCDGKGRVPEGLTP